MCFTSLPYIQVWYFKMCFLQSLNCSWFPGFKYSYLKTTLTDKEYSSTQVMIFFILFVTCLGIVNLACMEGYQFQICLQMNKPHATPEHNLQMHHTMKFSVPLSKLHLAFKTMSWPHAKCRIGTTGSGDVSLTCQTCAFNIMQYLVTFSSVSP